MTDHTAPGELRQYVPRWKLLEAQAERDRLRRALQRIADGDLPRTLHPAGTAVLEGREVDVQLDYGPLSASTFAREVLRVTEQETNP